MKRTFSFLGKQNVKVTRDSRNECLEYLNRLEKKMEKASQS